MESDNKMVEDSSNKSLFSGYRDSKAVRVQDPYIIQKKFNPNASDSSEDENNDEVQDEEEIVWKRKKKNHSNNTSANDGGVTFREVAMEFQRSRRKETLFTGGQSAYKEDDDDYLLNKRPNNVWGNVLMEQSLTDTIYGVGVEYERGVGNREIETYEYWMKHRSKADERVIDIPPENIRKRKRSWTSHYQKHESDEKFAKRLARRLKERKYVLIGNVVKCIGRKLAVELLYNTEEIEATGGIMTADQSRRKAPGGVYLHLLKNHPDVSKQQLSIIFEEDKRQFEQQKKKRRKLKKRKRKRLLQKQMENDCNKDDVSLPSIVDIALKEAHFSAMCVQENGKTIVKEILGGDMADAGNSDKESGEIDDDDDERSESIETQNSVSNSKVFSL